MKALSNYTEKKKTKITKRTRKMEKMNTRKAKTKRKR